MCGEVCVRSPRLAGHEEVGSGLEGDDEEHVRRDREGVARGDERAGRAAPHEARVRRRVTH